LQEPPKFTRIWIFGLKIKYLATLNSGAGARERGQKANLSENENENKKNRIFGENRCHANESPESNHNYFSTQLIVGAKNRENFFFCPKKNSGLAGRLHLPANPY
jgi:hypothetical protein